MSQRFVVFMDNGGVKVEVVSRWDTYEHAIRDANGRNLRAMNVGVACKYRVLEFSLGY
jgi:hypothetical protein